MNKKRKFPIFLIPLSLMLIVFLQAFISGEHDQTGEDLYRSYCASCHGVNGDGAGDLAYLVYPKPRDFTGGKFKIKSTLPGLPPTDDDLFKSISSGMPGTAMPSFNFLEEDEINTLVEIVKEHSGIENDNIHPMNIPEEIPFSDELIQLGKVVYDEAGCNMCHGDNGKGDGPSSDRLMDTYGFPIVPKDFTSGVYLGGGAIQDLYLRFVGGMDGTPMPSYGNLAELLGRPKTEESKLAWALVHYVKSLEVPQKDKINAKPNNGIIDAKKFERLEKFDDLTDGFSDIWKKSSTYSIPLSRLWQSENANYQMMGVQAIYNDEYVAVKLEWKDPTIDQGISRIQDFQDGAAIQFSLDGSKGFHGMGSKDHPTDIWFWKAEWQKRIDTNMESDITLAYANRVSDSDIKQFPSVMNDVAYLAGRDAGNLNAYTTQLSSIENARATGPETITPFHKDDQEVFGKGIWDGGKWRVVFVRKRIPSLIEKVNFNKNKSIPIGFAVWNGSEQDRNGQKMVSTWYDLELKD